MISESATFNRQDKIVELEFTGAQAIIQSLLLKHSTYDHEIPTSSIGLQCWKEAMDLLFMGKLLFVLLYVNTCF
jgi:hypothetical protein